MCLAETYYASETEFHIPKREHPAGVMSPHSQISWTEIREWIMRDPNRDRRSRFSEKGTWVGSQKRACIPVLPYIKPPTFPIWQLWHFEHQLYFPAQQELFILLIDPNVMKKVASISQKALLSPT